MPSCILASNVAMQGDLLVEAQGKRMPALDEFCNALDKYEDAALEKLVDTIVRCVTEISAAKMLTLGRGFLA